jgi:hypothetical protein
MENLRKMVKIISDNRPDFIEPSYYEYSLLVYWKYFINDTLRLIQGKFLKDEHIISIAQSTLETLIAVKTYYPDKFMLMIKHIEDYSHWLESECNRLEYYEVLSNLNKYVYFINSEIDKISKIPDEN